MQNLFTNWLISVKIAFKGPITRVDRAGPVCRDEIQAVVDMERASPERASLLWRCPFVSPVSQDGSVNAITWKNLSPVSRDPGQTGWSGYHDIAKLIFDVFNRHTGISAKRAGLGSCNQPHKSYLFQIARGKCRKRHSEVGYCCIRQFTRCILSS